MWSRFPSHHVALRRAITWYRAAESRPGAAAHEPCEAGGVSTREPRPQSIVTREACEYDSHNVPLPARILVRTNVDWHHMNADAFEQQDDPTRPLLFIRLASQRHAIDAFKEIFDFDFFAFRAEMKAIGAASLHAVRGARLTLGFRDFHNWLDDPEDEMVFPIDDDDVFHPELATLASSVAPETSIVVWQHAAFGHAPPEYHAGVGRFESAILMTNNWGVRKSFLRSKFSRDEALRFLCDHGDAQRHMLRLCGLSMNPEFGILAPCYTGLHVPSVRFVEGHFGLQLLHPASLTQVLYDALVGAEARFEKLDLEAANPLPNSLEWARPSVEQYHALIARLAATRAARVLRR